MLALKTIYWCQIPRTVLKKRAKKSSRRHCRRRRRRRCCCCRTLKSALASESKQHAHINDALQIYYTLNSAMAAFFLLSCLNVLKARVRFCVLCTASKARNKKKSNDCNKKSQAIDGAYNTKTLMKFI